MKKLIVSAAFLVTTLFATAQQKVATDKNGNYITVSATGTKSEGYKATGKTFTDSKGKTYPVYLSDRGKLFYFRVTQSGANIGKEYRAYLKVN